MGNIFSGTATDWGFGISDIWSSAMGIFSTLSIFVMLGLVIYLAPTLFDLVKVAIFYKQSTGKNLTFLEFFEELRPTHEARMDRKRRRRG